MPSQRNSCKVGPARNIHRKKVIGISGSPRQGGYSELLLDSALAGAASEGCLTEKIVLNNIRFKPCQACNGCARTGVCVVRDGMAAAYRKIRTADSLILSSPVFFGSVSAQVKMMVDRANFLWVARRGLKHKAAAAVKRGVFICAGGRDATRYFRNARKIVRIFFAVLGVRYSGEFLLDGLDSLGKNSPRVKRALKESYRLGAGLG